MAEAIVKVQASDELRELIESAARLDADTIAKVNAGAALAFALYHSAAELIESLPYPVLRAYMQASQAFDLGGKRGFTEVLAAQQADPLRVYDDRENADG